MMHFVVFRGGPAAGRVTADRVHLSYSAKGPEGPFVPVPLVGSTDNGTVIEGYIGSLRGITLPAHGSLTLALRVAVAGPSRCPSPRHCSSSGHS
ncbi:MAG TPA: hypothetical protein VEF89_13010 [Solirubrobacteraceae bacterium]|nr:hypothetical protein [Solirubrobacteraceae bacterium]